MEGFVKLHRRILKHAWLNDRPEYRVAWEDILLMGDHKTGKVMLRDVPAKKFFSSSGWSRFIARLLEDGMLSQLETLNQGCRSGKIQSALITKYHDYHARPEGANSRQGRPPLEAPEGALSSGRAAGEQRESIRASRTTNSAGQETESGRAAGEPFYIGLQEVEEVQEVKPPPTPPSTEPDPSARTGEYGSNLLQSQYPEVFRQLAKVKSVANVNTGQFQAWCSRVLSDCRAHGGEKIAPVLTELAVNYSSLSLPWKWYAKQITTLDADEQSFVAINARGGDQVRTPDGHVRTVLDVCSNGMVVFEDDSGPYHLRQLTLVGAVA